MKILYLSDVYFPRVNGVSTSIDAFRRELGARNHEVHLIAPDYGSLSDNEHGVLRIPARRLPMDPEDRLKRFRPVLRQLPRLHAERYDIVHVQTPFVAHYLGLRLSRELGIPCVETYHTFFEEYFHHYIPWLPKAWLKSAARLFSRRQGNSLHGMVVPSQPMLDVLRRYGVKTHAEVIPTGLPAASFTRADGHAFRRKYGIDIGRPVMLFVGRAAHEKNIGFLLRVTEQVRRHLPQALFVIAGEGPALAGLRAEVERRGLDGNVRFIGYLDRATELNACYSAADVFVFSSLTETQGLVLLEAMAQSLPVVAIAEMGTRDILKEGCGARIAQANPEDFAEKVLGLLRDPSARQELGQAARAYAETWTAGHQAERMLGFYRTVVADAEFAIRATMRPASSS